MKLKLVFLVVSSASLLSVLCSTIHKQASKLLLENLKHRWDFVISEYYKDYEIGMMNNNVSESSLCTLKVDHDTEIMEDLLKGEEIVESETTRRSAIDIADGSSKVLTRDHLSNLPDHLIILISSFLDFRISRGSLIETSKHFNNILHKSIEKRLQTFSPYFVFGERWMNRIMHFFLNRYFNEISDIEDESFYDALELLNIKHINIENYFEKHFHISTANLILEFLFELVYGPNEGVSISSNHWKQNFLQRLLKHDMPRCIEYYLTEFLKKNIEHYYMHEDHTITNQDNIITVQNEIISSIRSKLRNEDDLFDFYYSFCQSFYSDDFIKIAPEFGVVVVQNFHDTIIPQVEEDLMTQMVLNFSSRLSFSQSFLDRFPSNSDFLFNILQDKSHRKEARLISALYTKLVSNDNDPLKYMWTRDLLNPFDMQVFINLSGVNIQRDIKKAISELALCSNLYLIHLEIFRIIIQSGIYDFSAIQSLTDSLQYIICENSLLLFKIFREEVQTPINSILLDDDFKYVSILSKMRHFRSGYEKTLIFIETLKTDDPISLLFICQSNWLISEVSDVFVDKFNLKKRYTFDGYFSRFIYGNSNSMNFGRFNGQTLTFKQIIDSINVEGLIDIFTSNPASLDIDDVNLYPEPISFSKFINHGVYEPVY